MAQRIRRLLGRLRGKQAGGTGAPGIPQTRPVTRFEEQADPGMVRGWVGEGRMVLCIDVRPQSVLAHGIVEGAWLLSEAQVRDHGADLPGAAGPLVVLAETDAAGAALAAHLRGLGHDDSWVIPGGLPAWRETGLLVREPAWKSPLPVRHPVRVLPAALSAAGLPAQAPLAGVIQDVHWLGIEFAYTALVYHQGVFRRLEGLPEEHLQSLGERGAAGFGQTLSGAT